MDEEQTRNPDPILGNKTAGEKTTKPRRNRLLAIAIDRYSAGQRQLKYPVAECEQLIELLTERYDFDPQYITPIFNEKATKEILRDEVYELPKKLGPDDNLILLFSGHGFYDDQTGEGYLIPVDSPSLKKAAEAEDIFFPFQRIVKYLNNCPAHHIIFIIDSCFSGKFGQVTLKAPARDGEDMNQPEEKPSRWVLTSGRIQLVADNSPFAKAMFQVLQENREEKLLLQNLYAEIRRRMGEKEGQTAYCAEIVAGEDRGGEFAFRLRAGAATTDVTVPAAVADPADLLRRLRQGSRDYYDYLRRGRFAKLQFEKILLPAAQAELLDVQVNLEGEKTPLRQALEQHWQKKKVLSLEKPHTLLCGAGGMGKTVSCVRLWEELLEAGDQAPLPIFLPLNEYNATTEAERQSRNYVYRFLAREYLDNARLTPELEDSLKELFKPRGMRPAAVLLLDGFNEVTVEKNELMVEMAELVRWAQGVQIAVTSRYDMRSFAWTEGFGRLDLVDLTDNQIKKYLHRHTLSVPDNRDLLALLRNPMMLTLYTGASQLRSRFAEDRRLQFKERITSKEELLHNFFEGQLAKYLLDNQHNPHQKEEFLWQAFLIRHLLPYIAFRMVGKRQFFIPIRKLLNPGFNFKSVVEEAYGYFGSFDFTDLYPLYAGQREWLKFGIDEKDFDSIEARNEHIRKYLTDRLFLLAEEADTYRFLHQNFRDYFTAVHVQRDMEQAIAQNQGLPPEKRTLPPSLHQAFLDFTVRQLLGRLEGEYVNQPVYLKEENRWSDDHFIRNNLLEKVLNLCRGITDEEQLGCTIRNILTIWKEQRGELSGADLQQLNFKEFSFNDLRASRPGLPAYLSKGMFREENFFPPGDSSEVLGAVYSPDGRRILTASNDFTAKVWNGETGVGLLTVAHSSSVNSAVYSRDGGRILTASNDKTARVWDAENGICLLTLDGHLDAINSAVFSPDGARILTASYDKTARMWDAGTGTCLLILNGKSDPVNSAVFSPDGKRILTALGNVASVWDAETGTLLLTLAGHSSWVLNATYSPNAQWILTTGSFDKTARVWDAATGICLLTLNGESASISSAAFSPDGNRILTAQGHMAKVWDVETGECLLTLVGHSNSVRSAVYHPDGGRVLTASYDRTAKVWNAETGACLYIYSNIPGLFIEGCDFRDRHPDSKLSEEAIGLLRQYGAIFNEEDAQRWREAWKNYRKTS